MVGDGSLVLVAPQDDGEEEDHGHDHGHQDGDDDGQRDDQDDGVHGADKLAEPGVGLTADRAR